MIVPDAVMPTTVDVDLRALGEPVMVAINAVSGFPAISHGRRTTSADVADALDDE